MGYEYNVPLQISGATGGGNAYPFFLDIQLGGCHFDQFEVFGLPNLTGIALIGRDILNRYKLILDGINEHWSVESYECLDL